MALLARTDKGIGPLRFDAVAGTLPTPEHSPAYYDPDGNLVVEALIARDGLLRYTDAEGSWLEYRPAEELRKAAPSFAGASVTDQHPSRMVTPKTWGKVTKGVHIGAPKVVELDGVTFLQATLKYTDAALIAKIEKARKAGKRIELSIGFVTMSRTQSGSYHGRNYVAVQTDIRGNHTATLQEDEGRAGPSCRVLFDGADCPVGLPMSQATPTVNKKDAEGAPTDMVVVTAPDNSEQEVPSWIAAELEALASLRSGADPGATPPAPPVPAVLPEAPVVAPDAMGTAPAPGTPPQPPALPVPDAGAAAAPPARPPVAGPPVAPPVAGPPAPAEEDKADSLRARRVVERAATALGVTDAQLDVSSDDQLRRFVVATKTKMDGKALEGVEGDALKAMFDSATAIAVEAPKPAPTPWPGAPAPKVKNDSKTPDSARAALAAGMRAQGY